VDGPIEIDTQSDHRGRISRLVVLSAEATINGHPISDGYNKLRDELGRWRALRCHGRTRVLVDTNPHRVSTRLEFTGRQFIGAFIEPVPASTCLAPFPAG
jgi:hypothetical protein